MTEGRKANGWGRLDRVMPPALEVVTCLLEAFPNPNHVPLSVGRDCGFFREAGLEVALLHPSDPDDPLRLTAAGKVDFALGSQPGVLLARAAGCRVASIGLLIAHFPNTTMMPEGSEIRPPAEAHPLVFIANKDTVRHRAGLCRRFIGAMARAIAFTLKSPEEALEAFFAAHPDLRGPVHRETFETTLPFYARGQRQAPGRWADAAVAMAARGLLPTGTPDLGAFTNGFVPDEEGPA